MFWFIPFLLSVDAITPIQRRRNLPPLAIKKILLKNQIIDAQVNAALQAVHYAAQQQSPKNNPADYPINQGFETPPKNVLNDQPPTINITPDDSHDTGLDDTGLDDIGLDDTGLDDSGLDDIRLDDSGLDDIGMVGESERDLDKMIDQEIDRLETQIITENVLEPADDVRSSPSFEKFLSNENYSTKLPANSNFLDGPIDLSRLLILNESTVKENATDWNSWVQLHTSIRNGECLVVEVDEDNYELCRDNSPKKIDRMLTFLQWSSQSHDTAVMAEHLDEGYMWPDDLDEEDDPETMGGDYTEEETVSLEEATLQASEVAVSITEPSDENSKFRDLLIQQTKEWLGQLFYVGHCHRRYLYDKEGGGSSLVSCGLGWTLNNDTCESPPGYQGPCSQIPIAVLEMNLLSGTMDRICAECFIDYPCIGGESIDRDYSECPKNWILVGSDLCMAPEYDASNRRCSPIMNLTHYPTPSDKEGWAHRCRERWPITQESANLIQQARKQIPTIPIKTKTTLQTTGIQSGPINYLNGSVINATQN